MPFVDIHCHILPGIDDGPTDWGESLQMARLAAEHGTELIVATPHQLGAYADNTGTSIRSACAKLQRLLADFAVPVQVVPGADVRIEPELLHLLRTGQVLTVGDNKRYVLLELPHETYFPLESLAKKLASEGLVGILSHPERNGPIRRQPQLLDEVLKAGLLVQLTAASLTGAFGRTVKQVAEKMLLSGKVHCIASDAHGVHSRRPILEEAFHRTTQLVGELTARQLFSDVPRRIVEGLPVEKPRPERRRRSIFAIFAKRSAA